MKILLTGASSFTGYWFARELAAGGHHVVAPLAHKLDEYTGTRRVRVERLLDVAEVAWSARFGETGFMDLLTGPFDLLCHHAARVADYRSPEFDVVAALAENTSNLPAILRKLSQNGLRGMVLTGSVFEEGEGSGETPLRAFSPYGVSKGMTAQVVRYWCSVLRIPLGKFVIPNPFGPFEEPRFCNFLVSTWRKGEVAEIRTPDYVRDNIHVDLLAKAYGRFLMATANGPVFSRANPSGYVESQGNFAHRFAREMGPRLGLSASVTLLEQSDFTEPKERVNTEPVNADAFGWNERNAWDRLAEYYSK